MLPVMLPVNLNPLLELLEKCQGVKQDVTYHPEIDLFNHLIQCLSHAFRESIDTDLIIAAMLHDVGKIESSHGHEQITVEWLQDLVSVKTLWLIENHMRVWYLILGEMKRYRKVNELIAHPWLPELIHLARIDKLGRSSNRIIKYDREDIIDKLNKCAEKHFGRIPLVCDNREQKE